MSNFEKHIHRLYGDRIRVRVCGVCIEDQSILLVKHKFKHNHYWWGPPGGGLKYKECLEDALKREVQEETGLIIDIKNFLCVNEFLKNPYHAIEIFFMIQKRGGTLKIGEDPEIDIKDNMIQEVVFMPFSKIKKIPYRDIHSLFYGIESPKCLQKINGLHTCLDD